MNFKRILLSLSFQLGAIAVISFVLIAVYAFYNLQSAADLEYLQRSVSVAASQRSNILLLANAADRYTETADRFEREDLRANILDVITQFEATQNILRNGSDAAELDPIVTPSILDALDQVDAMWIPFRDTIREYITAPLETRVALNTVIDQQGIELGNITQQIVDALDAEARALRQGALIISLVLIALLGLTLLTTLAVVPRAVRSVRRLERSARDIAAGDLSARVDTKGAPSELAEVGMAFNLMGERVQQLFHELEEQIRLSNDARIQAERSDRVKSAFLAAMSHELRTPLNSVINYAKFVSKGMMGTVNDKQQEALNKVIDSGRHLLTLINDVLDMSKIESGSLNLFIEDDVNLVNILQSVTESVPGMIYPKPVNIIQEIDPNLPLLRGDQARIRQVMYNLLSNAAKFTERGYIKVKAIARDGVAYISVEDTGAGIEVEDQASVWEPFKQTRGGLRQGGGTGLGLPITRSLIEAHGGKITFQSTPGQGTTFFVALPLQNPKLKRTLDSGSFPSVKFGVTGPLNPARATPPPPPTAVESAVPPSNPSDDLPRIEVDEHQAETEPVKSSAAENTPSAD